MPDFIMEKMAGDMRAVAAKLEEFSKVYDAIDPAQYPWSTKQLRHEAEVLDNA